ncbi:uncharacterized mitochondrial protein AtMg00810-like [Cornus florida]|uniref:uncharacterized mitochondrial protein AtMg00810-like n=1 Tax=Cornus florida TaxID=4283 RepID=UPI0028A2AB87|nr:uncharacterized mitochondrial protein AtMg00810-like [Cornus florida]
MTGDRTLFTTFKECTVGTTTFGDGKASIVSGKDSSLMCFSTVTDETVLWHKRLRHVNYNDLVNLSNNDLVRGEMKELAIQKEERVEDKGGESEEGEEDEDEELEVTTDEPIGIPIPSLDIPTSSSSRRDSDPNKVDHFLYRSMIGSLLYLAATRPHISFSVGVCARYQADPREQHILTVKRIIRYVNSTLNYGLRYSSESNSEIPCYTDADWAGNKDDRKSTSGGCFNVGTNHVSWYSKK